MSNSVAGYSKRHARRLLKKKRDEMCKNEEKRNKEMGNIQEEDNSAPVAAKKMKYFVSDIIDDEGDDTGPLSNGDLAAGEEGFEWQEPEPNDNDEEGMMSIRRCDFKSLMEIIRKMSSDVSALKQEVRNLAAVQSLRDKSYTKDLRAIKRVIKPSKRTKWPVPDYDTFLAMEQRIQEDTEYKEQLKLELAAVAGDKLETIFDKEILTRFSLKGRAPLQKIESRPLLYFVAECRAEQSKESLKRVLMDFDTNLSRIRHSIGQANVQARLKQQAGEGPRLQPSEFVVVQEASRSTEEVEDVKEETIPWSSDMES